MPRLKERLAALGCVTLAASGLLLAGCTQAPAPGGPGGGPAAPGGGGGAASLVSAGQTVYNANGCANCHTINGQGGRQGPELTRTGATAGHTAEWLVEHVKNPKAHNPGSRMPPF